jgi:hypothetical protein
MGEEMLGRDLPIDGVEVFIHMNFLDRYFYPPQDELRIFF